MSEHSPGPWTIHGGIAPSGEGVNHIFADNDTDVAIVWGRSDAECVANARLIAAAPDLLKALRALQDLLEQAPSRASMDVLEMRNIVSDALKGLP